MYEPTGLCFSFLASASAARRTRTVAQEDGHRELSLVSEKRPPGGGGCHGPRTHAVLSLKRPLDDGRKIVARTFSMDTNRKPSSLLTRAKKAASESGATFIGDKHSGRFSHDMVRGEYRMVGQTVIVTVTEKHWLLPWPVVETQLRKLVGSV